ncbi:MAG: 2-hydroxyacid dehydrogenase [Chitinivibrionales bacterium]|nr:2-hydroxyacid dehydrogenase [Chitinivibrionales bacterium]MBD3395309.1 2-hydroxyacid dehydrogenase [Chitinivibrionales bacterium]
MSGTKSVKPRIAMFDTKSYDRDFFETVNHEYGFDILFLQDRLSSNTVSVTRDRNAVCAFVNDTLDRPVVEQLHENGIELIALRSAGYNNVDLKAVWKKIHVVRVPAYSPRAVAEHAVALMLALNRKTHRAYYRVRDNNFAIHGLMGFDMHGKTAGVVDTGKIGKAAADILRGFGMNVLAYDVYPDDNYAAQHGFRYVPLDTLYAESDIITLHCPLTPDNAHMINEDSIATMKSGVMIINTGRGRLINTQHLIDALKKRKVGAAGLDVYEEETDYFFEDFSSSTITDDVLARLLTFPNVLVTSHQGFFTREAMNSIARTTLENIRLFFEEDSLPNEICYKCGNNECMKEKTGKCF